MKKSIPLGLFGISPIDFLVLPRTLALFLMTPLLTLYADVVGMLGGSLPWALRLWIFRFALFRTNAVRSE